MTDEANMPGDFASRAGDEPAAAEGRPGSASQASDSPSDAQSSATPPAHSDASGAFEAADADATESLRAEVERLRAEAQSHLDDARRLKAEFENYRKRTLKEQTTTLERASSALVERLLPVLDAFRLALIAADRTKDYDGLVRGVELVYGELLDVMQKEGLEEIVADGKPFDPEVHEAVMESEGGSRDGHPYVVDVLRSGYSLKGRVLRPAMVKIEKR